MASPSEEYQAALHQVEAKIEALEKKKTDYEEAVKELGESIALERHTNRLSALDNQITELLKEKRELRSNAAGKAPSGLSLEKSVADLADQMKKMVTFQTDQMEKIEKVVTFQTGFNQQLRIISDQTAVEKRTLTPSAACLSSNAVEFTRLFSLLRLAEGPCLSLLVNQYQGDLQHDELPKFTFNWKTGFVEHGEEPGNVDVDNEEKMLERSSYSPLVTYLSSQSLHAVDVSEGQRCQARNLFDSDVFTIRPNTILDTATLMKTSQCPIFIQNVRGRMDIVVIDAQYANATYVTKFQVRVGVEIKTVAQMNSLDACLREAAVQLVGLNTENIERSPPVLLTNLSRRHFVLYLSMGLNPEVHLKYKMHIDRFETFEQALAFSLQRGDLPSISSHFGRRSTPTPSVGSEGGGDEDAWDDECC